MRSAGERAAATAMACASVTCAAKRNSTQTRALHRRGGNGRVDEPSVEQPDGTLRMARKARVVSDHYDRRAAFVKLAQQFHHGFAVLRVEIPGRLRGEENRGIDRERAGHR